MMHISLGMEMFDTVSSFGMLCSLCCVNISRLTLLIIINKRVHLQMMWEHLMVIIATLLGTM
jgi:hypothetical protein